jgi:hypothetical protein
MSREFQLTSFTTEWNEPLWPYDMDDSYLQLDFGDENSELHPDLRVFKKPWFKLNYRHTSSKNLKFYKRPFFQVEALE